MVSKLSKTLFRLKARTFFPWLKWKLSPKTKIADPVLREKEVAKVTLGYIPDLDNPKSLNEKFMWLKLFYRNDLWRRCADKLEVKTYLNELGLSQFVPKVLGGPYPNSGGIDLTKLPKRFVLKTNHDCGSVFLCEQGKTDFKKVFSALDVSLHSKYSARGGNDEWVYDKIKPIIFAEEVLGPYTGGDLCDYKFFCFNGEPKFLYVLSNRNVDERLNLKTLDYQDIDCIHVMLKNKHLPKEPPFGFEEMKSVASKIAKHFGFVRVDFYATKQGPKIGELTFFPTSGHGAFYPRKYDYEFGSYLDLSFAKND